MPSVKSWKIVDTRDGSRVSQASFLTEESAWWHVMEWQNRHSRGERPDISWELLLHMKPVRDEDS